LEWGANAEPSRRDLPMSSGTILVTGGAGYVGSHACKALHRCGYKPVVMDDLSTGHESFVRWGPLLRIDIRNTAEVAHAIRACEAEAVLHFAGSAVSDSLASPQKYYDNNVAGSLSLFNAMLETQCRKLVFSSSCAIYGEPAILPIAETAPKNPITPYGLSKLMVERMLSDYGHAYAFESVALRYFNASGADPDGEIGELREQETHLIPRAIMAAQGQIAELVVYGDDYATPDGTAVRDYVHVSDLAEAHVTAVRRLLAGEARGEFNLGTGRGYSVEQVLRAIETEAGTRLNVVRSPRRDGDPAALVADPTLARAQLSFAPTMSDLETIVRTAWRWHRKTAAAAETPQALA
jgi:UDP-glucose-4-epimerase GalE